MLNSAFHSTWAGDENIFGGLRKEGVFWVIAAGSLAIFGFGVFDVALVGWLDLAVDKRWTLCIIYPALRSIRDSLHSGIVDKKYLLGTLWVLGLISITVLFAAEHDSTYELLRSPALRFQPDSSLGPRLTSPCKHTESQQIPNPICSTNDRQFFQILCIAVWQTGITCRTLRAVNLPRTCTSTDLMFPSADRA